jgi:uncharacterized protein
MRFRHHPAVDHERGRVLSAEAASALHEAQFFAVKPVSNYAVTVLTATACNLGCNYCFQNTAMADPGSHAPPRIERASLSASLVDDTVRFVRRQQQKSSLDTVSLLLFGGEPLLNVAGCLRLLRGLRPLRLVDAEIVTNGVLLTRNVATKLASAGLHRVQITFDGARASHDVVRTTRNGRPTYDKILRNVEQASTAVPQLAWNFRVNVSHHNLEGLEQLIEGLAPVAAISPEVTFHLALIDDTGLGYENNVGYDAELADTFKRVNHLAIQHGMRIPPSKSLSECPYCAAPRGERGAVINADGYLYSCWENAGRDGWAVGHVSDGYDAPAAVAPKWVACDFDIKSHGDKCATRAFFDEVDAAALDNQREAAALLPA